jgi:transposase-like protein
MSQPIPINRGSGDGSPQSLTNGGGPSPSTEVQIKPRRRFTAAYKRRILDEAAAAPHGGVGLILRRENLTHAHLQTWRQQLRKGVLVDLRPDRPSKTELERENHELKRENAKLKAEAEKLGIIVEYQKRLAKLLGEPKIPETPS